MNIHLYTLCWNEVEELGFFFRHYDPWVTRYVVFDDGSTDGSVERLKAHPRVELRRFERTHPESFVLSHQELQNNIWKESRGSADWVVITAIDEHLFVPGCDMAAFLRRCTDQGVTLVPALGYQMLCEDYPASEEWLCHTRTRGAPFLDMNKLSVFNPTAISETNFDTGRHYAVPAGQLVLPSRDELLLLHYKYLGFERTAARQAAQRSGLGAEDIARNFAFQYAWSREQLREDWDKFAAQAVDISSPTLEAWRTHPAERWWRRPPPTAPVEIISPPEVRRWRPRALSWVGRQLDAFLRRSR